MANKSEDLRKRVRRRLAEAKDSDADFDALRDLVDGQLEMATGGQFTEFGSHERFLQGPQYPPSPGDPTPPGVPEG